jgi:alginate O-acetyltransferase complex protein AlgI
LGGLWHGAAWPFVFWGALHGLFLIINHAWNDLTARAALRGWRLELGRVPAQVLTLLSVTLAWVFFAAPSFAAAVAVLVGMAGGHGMAGSGGDAVGLLLAEGIGVARDWYGLRGIALNLAQHAPLVGGLAIVLFAPNSQQMIDGIAPATWPLSARKSWRFAYGFRTALAAAGGLLLSLALMADVKEFVYFQF